MLDIYDQISMFSNLNVGCSSAYLVHANSTLCLCVFCLVRGNGKVHPCTGRTAHRESRGIALPFHDHGTRRG